MCAERVRTTGLETLDVLPCGPKPVDPAELLSGDRLAEVMAWAESNYDQVLIDCPPVLAAADAALVGRAVEGVVLVVQPEKNHRRLVLRAAESLRSLEVNLVGLVANKIGTESGGAYDTYGYGYGYHEQDDEAGERSAVGDEYDEVEYEYDDEDGDYAYEDDDYFDDDQPRRHAA
jgi:Mrp family chromosome partitioning ATPase